MKLRVGFNCGSHDLEYRKSTDITILQISQITKILHIFRMTKLQYYEP